MRRMYFGHPINTYNTELEQQLLRYIKEAFPKYEIENPNQPHHQAAFQEWKKRTGNGMGYFLEVVLPYCHGGTHLVFRDFAWGAGVFAEAKVLADNKCPNWRISAEGIIVMADLRRARVLSIAETRARLRTPDGVMIPF